MSLIKYVLSSSKIPINIPGNVPRLVDHTLSYAFYWQITYKLDMFVNINKYHWNVYIYGTQGSPGHTIFWILNWHSRYDMNKLQCHLPNLLLKYRTTQLKSCSKSPTQVVWCQVWNFPCRRCSVLYIWSLCGFVVSRDNANIGKYTSFILHKLAFLIGFQINKIHLF